jgi:hypothetical protein
MRLEATHAEGAKQPQQHQDDENQADDPAQAGKSVGTMRVIPPAAPKEQK